MDMDRSKPAYTCIRKTAVNQTMLVTNSRLLGEHRVSSNPLQADYFLAIRRKCTTVEGDCFPDNSAIIWSQPWTDQALWILM